MKGKHTERASTERVSVSAATKVPGPASVDKISCLSSNIHLCIFEQTTTVIELSALACASPRLYASYKRYPQQVIRNVLCKEIPDVHQYDAYFAMKIRGTVSSVYSYKDLMRSYFSNVTSMETVPISLAEGKRMSKTHTSIMYFVRIYIQQVKACKLLKGDGSTYRLTGSERIRIIRAFYRFEIYCSLFSEVRGGNDTVFSALDQHDLFLTYYSTWENEQLFSVYEFMCTWFHAKPPKHTSFNNRPIVYSWPGIGNDKNIEFLVSRGAKFTHEYATSEAFRFERRELFRRSIRDNFLFRATLAQGPATPSLHVGHLNHVPEEEARDLWIRRPRHDDGDEGPARAWTILHRDARVFSLYGDREFTQFREAGYVFFDDRRILLFEDFLRPS